MKWGSDEKLLSVAMVMEKETKKQTTHVVYDYSSSPPIAMSNPSISGAAYMCRNDHNRRNEKCMMRMFSVFSPESSAGMFSVIHGGITTATRDIARLRPI